LDDAETYALLQRGETKGIFQLESGGIRDLLTKMKPDSFRDIIATNALYRPGPLGGGMVESYVNRKHGREKPEKMHPVLQEVLAETYGVMVYQEQVMRILNRLGGIELSQAYSCIKAISKKKLAEIAKYQAEFVAGAQERGLSSKQARDIFELICHFGGYGFNKSHSTAYALIAYQTAYLKAHYPAEFMAALLSCEMGITDRIGEHVDDCRRMGIEVMVPDVNTCEAEFGVRDGKITYGLAAIKGVGRPAVEALASARADGGPFASIYDFCERVDPRSVNRSAVETLVKAGAFDSLGARREQLLAVLDRALQAGSSAHEDRRRGQKSLFGHDDDETPAQAGLALPDVPAWSDTERLGFEKQALGFYITSHPLARHEVDLRLFSTHTPDQIADLGQNARATVGGMVSSIKYSNTKRARNGNTRFAMFDLEGLGGSIRCILWPEDFAREGERLVADAIVFVEAEVDRSREEPNLIVKQLIPLDSAAERLTRGMVIRLESGVHAEGDLEMVREVLSHHPGRCAVFLEVLLANRKRVVLQSQSVNVGTSPAVREELEQILGPGHVRFLAANGSGNGGRNGNGNGYRNGAGR
jgi:DNA polymerase-3 subunit alpha